MHYLAIDIFDESAGWTAAQQWINNKAAYLKYREQANGNEIQFGKIYDGHF